MGITVATPAKSQRERYERRTLALLAIITAIGSLGLAAGGTAWALLGAELAGTEAAGLPLGALVVGQALAALLIANRTQVIGRGKSLALGYLIGTSGAGLVIVAALFQSFAVLMVGSAVLGGGNAAVFLTRYAAAEVGDAATNGFGLGFILFAAAVGAVASPNLLGPSGVAARHLGFPPLTGLYFVAMACSVVAAALLVLTSIPEVPYLGRGAAWLGPCRGSSVRWHEVALGIRNRPARAALIVLAVTNLVMVAVMAIAPVHMVAHGHSLNLVGFIVSVHVAGMFVPSLLSGWAADRLGAGRVAAAGLVLLVGTGVAGALIDSSGALPIALMLAGLGLGWNFGLVGGSILLAASVPVTLKPQVEGIGEVTMGLAAGLGASLAGVLIVLGGFETLSLVGAATAALAFTAFRQRGAATRKSTN